jgi:hypothetical protein
MTKAAGVAGKARGFGAWGAATAGASMGGGGGAGGGAIGDTKLINNSRSEID